MGQHRKVLIAKDVNYGASKTNTAANSALNPADLKEGAIGIYGIDPSSANNAGKMAILTDGGTDATGKVPAASFTGKEIIIAIGTAKGCQLSNPIDAGGIKSIASKAYTAPVKGVFGVGYNATEGAGSLNYPSTVKRSDEFAVQVTDRNSFITGNRQPFSKERYAVQLAADDGEYVACKKLVNYIIDRINKNEAAVSIAAPKIASNATGAVFANAGDATVTNGSKDVTVSGVGHGVTAGDYIVLAGDLYIAAAVPTVTTITLDRVYSQASGTVANADTLDVTTAATEHGLEFTDANVGSNIELTVSGIIPDATLKRVVTPKTGSGSADHVKRLEKDALPYKGSHDQIHSYMPLDSLKYDPDLTYDLYFFTVKNDIHAGGDQGSVFNVVNKLNVAFPSTVADTAGKNQSDFEDIITNFYSDLVSTF